MRIILASESERRRELIKKISDDVVVIPSNFNEKEVRETDPVKFAVRAATLKAEEVGRRFPDDIVIGADTVVALNDEIIGKPADREDARKTLMKLSGSRHRVITGIAIFKASENKLSTGFQITKIDFKKLSPEDIDEYLALDEYRDKAGSYAVQENGDRFVQEINGSYNNVVGLPVKRLRKLLDDFLAPEFTADIYDIALPKNWGVTRHNNMIVFVPDSLPGDRVKLQITGRKKNFSYGRVLETIRPSAHRVEPECPHFGICGGCAFQNLEYSKQVELKESFLLKSLEKLGGVKTESVKKEEIVTSPDIFYYRNKMEFAFGNTSGGVELGLRERFSPVRKRGQQGMAALSQCLIFSRQVEKIFPIVRDFAASTGLEAYNTYTGKGFFRHLVLREGKNTGDIMAIIVTRSSETPEMVRLLEDLTREVPSMKSLWWFKNDRPSDVVTCEKGNLLYGTEYLREKIGEMSFRVYPSSFFQPNTRGAELLYGWIKSKAESLEAKNILGLYCGSGAIEMTLSPIAERVCGIDNEHSNIKSAIENCRDNNIQNCLFYHDTVEKALKKQVFEKTDIVVIDPPRAGLTRKATEQIISVSARHIIYVSCNPATFARDIKYFKENGYLLRTIACFDLFPHTTHMESVGLLEKK